MTQDDLTALTGAQVVIVGDAGILALRVSFLAKGLSKSTQSPWYGLTADSARKLIDELRQKLDQLERLQDQTPRH